MRSGSRRRRRAAVLELQVCRDCGTVQYPPREACRVCLSHRLDWRAQDGGGELVSETPLHHSNELFYRERMPWRLGMVKLDCGPVIVAHLHGDCAPAPSRVRVPCQSSTAPDRRRWSQSRRRIPRTWLTIASSAK